MGSQEAFDLIAVASGGALVFARIFDLIFRNSSQSWSVARLVFFNRYGSFDFYGAIVGIMLAIFVFLRSKKTQVWFVLDLAAAPIVFAQAIITMGNFLGEGSLKNNPTSLYYFFAYLLIFLVLKRLAAKKRHVGLFFSFYLVSIAFLDMVLFKFKADIHYLGKAPYELMAPAVIFTLALVNWHFLAKRSFKDEGKRIVGFTLLSVFRTKRMLASTDEAGKLSKSIILFPYYMLRMMLMMILLIAREIKLGFLEFLYVLGFRKFLK